MNAIVVVNQNRMMQRFREAKATGPKSAVTLAEIGCRNSWVFRRMQTRGVFVETDAGQFYMDEDAARRFVKLRWRIAVVFLALVILGFVTWQIAGWLS